VIRVRCGLSSHPDCQVRLIVFSRINFPRFRFEAVRFNYQFVFLAGRDAKGDFALVIGHSFPSIFLLIRLADARPGARKSKTLVCKNGGENYENLGMRIG
jgi:hypothetical protein